MTLLESFRYKNIEAKDRFLCEGLKFDVSEIGNLEHKPCCSVNIESKNLLANIGMWWSGECELLVTGETAEEMLFNKYRIVNSESELQSYLEDLYGVLRDVNNRAS